MAKRLLLMFLLALIALSVVRLAPEAYGGKCKYCRRHIHKPVCYAIVGVDASGEGRRRRPVRLAVLGGFTGMFGVRLTVAIGARLRW